MSRAFRLFTMLLLVIVVTDSAAMAAPVRTALEAGASVAADVQTTVATGAMPSAAALDVDAGKLYVTNFGSGTVSVIDVASLVTIADIEVGANPNAVAINRISHVVYVLNQGSDSVSVIDGGQNRVAATIRVGRQPWAIALDVKAGRLYVANRRSGTVSIVDTRSLEVTNVAVGEGPMALVLDSQGQVYVANQGSNNVSIVDPQSRQVVEVRVGQSPLSLAYNPLNDYVYVAHEEPVVSVIDAGSGYEVERLLVSARAALAVDPTDGQTYLAGAEELLVFGVRNNLVHTVPLPAAPTEVVPDPDAGRVYVSHWDRNEVSIVDTTSGEIRTHPVGTNPSDLVVDRQGGRVFVVNTAYPGRGTEARAGSITVVPTGAKTARPESDRWPTTATAAGKWTAYEVPSAAPGLQRLVVANDDTIWIGAKSGAWHFEHGQWTNYTVADGLAGDDVRALAQSADGSLWFGTWGAGVSRFDGVAWTTYTTTDGLANDDIHDIVQAPDGAMWIGTFQGGVSRFDGTTWTTYTTADGLAANRVTALATTPDGAVWAGTYGGGVSRFDGNQWTTYTAADGLPSNYIRDVAVTGDGRVWVYGYIFGILDGQQWTTSWLSPFSGGQSLNQDAAGNIWYANGTLNGYDGIREYRLGPQGESSALVDLALDSQENKWVLDSRHLYCFKDTLPDLKLGAHVVSVKDEGATPGWPAASRSLQLAHDAGFQYVQIPVIWGQIEPYRGVYRWHILHNILDQTQGGWESYDLFPVLRIFAPPWWARPPASTPTAPPNDPQYLADFMHALVREFGTQFAYVIWNEPNLPEEWGGQTPNAANYVTLLRAAYRGAKSAHPFATVISASLTPTEGGNGAVRDIDFLDQMYAAGLAEACDAVGMNGIGFASSPDDTSHPLGYNFSRLLDLRAVMVNHGDDATKVWLLEVGWLRNTKVDLGDYNWQKVSDAEQAAYLIRAEEKVRTEWPWVEAMFLWNLDYDGYLSAGDQRYWFSFGSNRYWLGVKVGLHTYLPLVVRGN